MAKGFWLTVNVVFVRRSPQKVEVDMSNLRNAWRRMVHDRYNLVQPSDDFPFLHAARAYW